MASSSSSSSAAPAPPDPPAEQLPEWLKEALATPKQGRDVPPLFLFAWGSVSAIALGGGALIGVRAFEDSVAFEALDKMEAPTPKAEKDAARMAARAFGWGTAAAVNAAPHGHY